jgi:hypothetical protein
VEQAFPGVYFNPARWDTADGYIPFPVFDLYAAALWRARAVDRVNLAGAITQALAEKKAQQSLLASNLQEAFPAVVTNGRS